MLDALRRGAGTWVAKIFLGLLVISFGIWGIQGFLGNQSATSVAKVGDEEIAASDFNRNYQLLVRNMSQYLRRNISPQEAVARKLPDQVLSALVSDAVLDNVTQSLSLGVSDDRISRAIATDKRFVSSGRFDRNQFSFYLRNMGLNEDKFVTQLQAEKRREQLLAGLLGGMGAPNVYLEAKNRFDNEERAVRYVVLKPELLGEIAAPDDAALDAYFNENRGEYRAPERRTATVLKLGPEEIMKPDEVTKEELEKEYKAKLARYVVKERRHILQIPFPLSDKAVADAARAKLDGGLSFEDLAVELKLDSKDYDLGTKSKDQLLDKPLADAAFELEEGQVSGVVKGTFRYVIIKVAKIEPGKTRTLAEVEKELRAAVAKRKAEKDVVKLYEEIEDVRVGGVSLTEVAERFKLKTIKLDDVDRLGRDKDGKDAVALPQKNKVMAAIFKAKTDAENDPIQVGTPVWVWFELDGIEAAHDRTLAEVRDKAIADWKTAEINKRLGEMTTGMVNALKAGGDFEKLAAEKNLTVETSEKFKRRGGENKLPQSVRTAAFGGPKGFAGSASGAGQERYVFVVNEVDIPAFLAGTRELDQLAQQTAEQITGFIRTEYIRKMQDSYQLKIDQRLIQQIIFPSGS